MTLSGCGHSGQGRSEKRERRGRKKGKQKWKSRSKKRGENLHMKTLPGLRTDSIPVAKVAPGLSAVNVLRFGGRTWGSGAQRVGSNSVQLVAGQ